VSTLAEQVQRWMSGKLAGSAKPVCKVYVREGHLERHYANKPSNEVFCYVPGLKGPNAVWWAHWVADTAYKEVPNVFSIKGENDFSQNGIEQITMALDNVAMEEKDTGHGTWYEIARGFMAPTRGVAGMTRGPAGTANEWRGLWKNQATQIMVVAGYGEAFFPVFLGLLDSSDLTSRPDQITVMARSMGKIFTDQHVFMDAKNLFVKDPITFCDRQAADELENIANNASVSSDDGSHPARFGVDGSDDTAWISGGNDSEDATEWFEVTIPSARIEDFRLNPRFAGMECFVSVYATSENVQNGGPARTTDDHNVGEGWVGYESLGNVPGTTIPYVAHYEAMSGEKIHYKLRHGGGGYVVGDSSKVRLTFRNLARVSSGGEFRYRAGVTNLELFGRRRTEAAAKHHWILVDDVSDIVKVVCQWAGFSNPEEWEIERVGSRLKDKIVFDRSEFLIDIIKKIEDATSYTFQIRPPKAFDPTHLDTGHNLQMGVVTFRQNQAMTPTPKDPRYVVSDSDTLTGIQPQFDDSGLAQSIRTRGKLKVTQKILEDPHYVPTGGTTERFGYNYRPVWARDNENRAAGIRKHEFHVDNTYSSNQDCKVACLLIAYRMTLEAAKASVQLPFFPPVQLDSQFGIFDVGTGLSTRLWVVSRDWEFQSGAERNFTMTLGGSLLDVDIVEATRKELREVLAHEGYDPAPIARGPWEEVHLF
jgi:hypothetical protein